METRRILLLAALTLCVSASAADADGLVAHWKLDETSGTIAADSSGNGHDGILGGGLSFDNDSIPGPSGNALHFDGRNDYINVPTISAPTGAITVALWFRPDSDLDASSGRMELLHWANPIQRPHLTFSFLGNGKMALSVSVNGEAYNDTQTTSDSWMGLTWYHIAITFDGVDFKVYLEGQLDGTATHTGTLDPTSNLYIGRHRDPAHSWDGVMDDVRIYDRALSAEEVWALYDIQRGVAVDIKPTSCPNPLNLTSGGMLPVAILGSEELDVAEIDVAAIQLAGIGPVRSSFEDVATPLADGSECECTEEGPDGYLDLTLKFKTRQIAEEIINTVGDVNEGEFLVLPLTAALYDGTAIEGEDCVRIAGKASRALAAKKADVDGDGIVNIYDYALVAAYWLEYAVVDY
jgi:hypothetical protein